MYYQVVAKCGHVGKNNYIEKTFYIRAESGKEAARMVRYAPRVKHHKKDAILCVREISREEFLLGRATFKSDLYFRMTSSHEQRLLNAVKPDEIKREPKRKKYLKTRNAEYQMKRFKILENQCKQMVMEAFYGQA